MTQYCITVTFRAAIIDLLTGLDNLMVKFRSPDEPWSHTVQLYIALNVSRTCSIAENQLWKTTYIQLISVTLQYNYRSFVHCLLRIIG